MPPTPIPDDANPSRRSFLQAGAAAILLAGAAQASSTDLEWRDKQQGMAYRRLGRTDMMISEVVCGGDPITLSPRSPAHQRVWGRAISTASPPAPGRPATRRGLGIADRRTQGFTPETLPGPRPDRVPQP